MLFIILFLILCARTSAYAHGDYLAHGILFSLVGVSFIALLLISLLFLNIKYIYNFHKNPASLKIRNLCSLFSISNLIASIILIIILFVFNRESPDIIKLVFIIIPEIIISLVGIYYIIRFKIR